MSKLGPHCLRPTDSAIRMAKAGAKVFKLVDDFGIAKDILAIRPDAVVVGRAFTPYDPISTHFEKHVSPAEAARDFLYGSVNQMAHIAANPTIQYWEGPNEVVCNSVESMLWYAVFEQARIQMMRDVGKKCVIGNFSTGNPQLQLWPHFFAALREGEINGAFLGLHEYSWPDMYWMTGAENGVMLGWTTLRYRRVYRDYLLPNGISIPLFIGELGVDPATKPYPPSYAHLSDGGAFRDGMLRDIWAGVGATDPDRYYANQLIWYDNEIGQDSYVIGATIYTVGSTDQWRRFDIDGQPIVDILCEHFQLEENEMAQCPMPLYAAKTNYSLRLRDANGNVTKHPLYPDGIIYTGRTVFVYGDTPTVGPNASGQVYHDRVTITPDGLNVWGGTEAMPALKKIE